MTLLVATVVAVPPAYAAPATGPVPAGGTVVVNDAQSPTGSIAGRLTRPGGTQAAYWVVQADGDDDSGSALTDGFGHYRIDNLAPGSYRLLFLLPSGARQWAPQARSRETAGSFAVSADTVTTHDEQLLPTGSVDGRFTDAAGNGMAGISVTVFDVERNEYLSGSTTADGRYRIDGVLHGDYRVRFTDWQSGLDQYAHGKLTEAAADPITVAANQTTTVDDSRLPTGSVRITARDSVTGAVVPDFFATVLGRGGASTGGAVVIDEVPAGSHVISASGENHPYVGNAATVTVVAGEQTDVELTLRPYARITTRVTDRASGAPVGDICVVALPVKTFPFPGGCSGVSDPTGAATLRVSESGAYNLLVLPEPGSDYGAQWVGSTGGTGTQQTARRVTVAAGEVRAVPKIKLDPRGTISGTVTGATGAPVQAGSVSIAGPDLSGSGHGNRGSQVAADGSYEIDWLGPYEWPLLFSAADHAYQWSGTVGNRLNADPVSVQAGATTDFDHTLTQGTNLVVTAPGEPGVCRLVVRNAVTSDGAGLVHNYSPTSGTPLRILGGQKVKIELTCGSTRWYGGTDLASATAVTIPAQGTVSISFPAV
ncbi:carboxypeptidase regulatory-like domain-containing protein [Micromonospora sp. NBC_01699]|uniref:carboxypeptidase regulatory-like domain-containing protein n=1 Tax=Micromonospora sp. NBC_01699 TaxID=2975984 RepID=UPI002E30C4EE|nr:carboxypeptidase regulatory-like domain-containing protein [Micromonospora sp. NBC_01699]